MEFLMSDDQPDWMYKWVEEHDKSCQYNHMSNISGRFVYNKVKKVSENTCVVSIKCLCGEVKEVTIKCWC